MSLSVGCPVADAESLVEDKPLADDGGHWLMGHHNGGVNGRYFCFVLLYYHSCLAQPQEGIKQN